MGICDVPPISYDRNTREIIKPCNLRFQATGDYECPAIEECGHYKKYKGV